jgi:hypothetical protein
MCGIVGVVLKHSSGFYKQTDDCFQQLLYADALRGADSTGIIGIETDSTFHIMKEANEAAWFVPQFVSSEVNKRMFNKGKAIIGHNRKKTMGEVKDETAHPFVVDDEFALVHNGTLFNHEQLAKTEVDSEALAITLAKAFEEEEYISALEKTLPTINGAYAVACYDQRHEKIRLLRNKDRPLSIVETNNAWYFASEAAMLFWILARNGYSGKDLEIKGVPEDTVFTFDLTAFTTNLTEEKLTLKKETAQGSTLILGKPTSNVKYLKKGTPVVEPFLSKNEYKRLRKKYLGVRVEWWCNDYIETHYPKTLLDGETEVNLMGECTLFPIDCVVNCKADVKQLDLKEKDLADSYWSGIVEQMTYDTVTNFLTIYLDKCKLVPTVKNKPEIIDAKWIKERLDANEKASQPTLH